MKCISIYLIFRRIFQRKISANRWASGRAASIRLKVLVKVLFSDNKSDVFEWNDTWNINRYICKVLHKARIITVACIVEIISP